jgi:hypothetical protein
MGWVTVRVVGARSLQIFRKGLALGLFGEGDRGRSTSQPSAHKTWLIFFNASDKFFKFTAWFGITAVTKLYYMQSKSELLWGLYGLELLFTILPVAMVSLYITRFALNQSVLRGFFFWMKLAFSFFAFVGLTAVLYRVPGILIDAIGRARCGILR